MSKIKIGVKFLVNMESAKELFNLHGKDVMSSLKNLNRQKYDQKHAGANLPNLTQ